SLTDRCCPHFLRALIHPSVLLETNGPPLLFGQATKKSGSVHRLPRLFLSRCVPCKSVGVSGSLDLLRRCIDDVGDRVNLFGRQRPLLHPQGHAKVRNRALNLSSAICTLLAPYLV